MSRVVSSLLVGALLLGSVGCTAEPAAPRAHPRASYGDDELVLRVDVVGGLIPIDYYFTELPLVAIYGDGRVITEGPVDASSPGPALPNLRVATISQEDLARIVRLAIGAGVGDGRDYGTPEVMDAPSTRFRVNTDAGVLESVVLALGIGDTGLTAGQRAARARLRDLVHQLTDLPATLGAGAVRDEGPYDFDTLAVRVRPWPAEQTRSATLPWPGPAALTSTDCTLLRGAELAPVRAAVAPARRLTAWVWEDQEYEVLFRPLLPDERTCDDLNDW